MKALTIVATPEGGKLEFAEVPAPGRLRRNEVLIDIYASSVSRADTGILRSPGRLVRSPRSFMPDDEPDDPDAQPGPTIGGGEYAGIVAAVGDAVERYRVGDRVMGMCLGGLAEQLAVDYRHVMPMPAGLEFTGAAALPACLTTAHDAITRVAGLQPGESVLIHTAAGGVGSIAIQLARAMGASTIYGTTGSDDKANRLPALGLDVPINYRTQDFAQVVTEHSGGRGVDVILDMVGGPHLKGNVTSLAIEGRMISIGKTGGFVGELDLDRLSFKRAKILGTTFRTRTFDQRVAAVRAAETGAMAWLEAGIVRPVVDRVYPFAEAPKAYAHVSSGANFGRVVVQVR